MTWNVITAGPSAGKSSTIRELSARGYRTAPEAARLVLDQVKSEGLDPKEFRRGGKYQQRVEAADTRITMSMPNDETVFFDRSVADNIAYRTFHDNVDTEEIASASVMAKSYFDNVFLLDRIEFEEDDVRTEDEQEAQGIHRELRRTYSDLGFDIEEVPVMPVDERVDYILEKIDDV
jgi:predicted ATPase